MAKGKRDTAKLVQISEGPAALREWEIDKYAYGLELERRKKARLAEEAIQDYSAGRCIPQDTRAASIKAVCQADRTRTNVKDREEQEDKERRNWARRALEVLVKNGWINPTTMTQ